MPLPLRNVRENSFVREELLHSLKDMLAYGSAERVFFKDTFLALSISKVCGHIAWAQWIVNGNICFGELAYIIMLGLLIFT